MTESLAAKERWSAYRVQPASPHESILSVVANG